MAVNLAQRLAADAELHVAVATITLSGRRHEDLRQAEIFLNPVIKRRIRSLAFVLPLRPAENLKGSAALEHPLDTGAQIPRPFDDVHRLAEITFVISIAA